MKGKQPSYDNLTPKPTSPGVVSMPLQRPNPPLPTFSRKVTQWMPPGGHAPQPGQPPVEKKTVGIATGPGFDDPNGFVNAGNPKGFTNA